MKKIIAIIMLTGLPLCAMEQPVAKRQKLDSFNQALLDDARAGMVRWVKDAIEGGANINTQDNEGNTPLMLSSEHKHDDVVRFLLKNEADVNKKNNDGETALMRASIDEGPYTSSIIKLLLKAGADINAVSHEGHTALMIAAMGPNEKNT